MASAKGLRKVPGTWGGHDACYDCWCLLMSCDMLLTWRDENITTFLLITVSMFTTVFFFNTLLLLVTVVLVATA